MTNRITLQTDAPYATPMDDALARQIGEVLQQHYPGHPWDVNVSSFTGVVHVQHPALSTKSGYIVPMAALATHGDLVREVMRIGGRFLEQFGLPRSWAREHDLIEHGRRAAFH